MAKANIGFALGGQGKVSQGVEYIDEVIAAFKAAGSTTDLEAMLDEKGRMLERNGMYKDALATSREQQALREQLFRSDSAKAVATLQEQFDADNRIKQIALLGRENALKDADIRNRRLQQAVTLMGAALTLIAGGAIYFLYRRVRKANRRLLTLNSELAFHATHDALTGLLNRRYFVEKMQARARNPAGERRAIGAECITLMDIDYFKQINDNYGHAVGDAVLVEVARRLQHAVRDTDQVLRWGGEEFLAYSPGANPDQVQPMVERFMNAIGATPVVVGNHTISVTMTAGFLALPQSAEAQHELGWEKAVKLADIALYYGKARGRNRATGLDHLRHPWDQSMQAIEQDIERAAADGIVHLVHVNGPEQDCTELASAS